MRKTVCGMKRFLVIVSLFIFWGGAASAAHIKGGEVFYTYLGPGAGGNDRFRISVKLFIDCGSQEGQLDNDVNVAIYKTGTNQAAPNSPFTLGKVGDNFLRLSTPSPCIINPSPVCYRIMVYSTIIELPKEAKGYTALFQRCCRINGIANLSPNNSVGASYTCEIHGSENLGPAEVNTNPQFLTKDTVLICQRRRFSLDFSALDPDGDSLSYQFCAAYQGGNAGNPRVNNPLPPGALQNLSYSNGFSGGQPLGPDVTINPQTGIISGVSPNGGDYVVCVCITEWRRGKPLTTHRKDFIIRVDANCDFAAAELQPSYITCDGYDFTFSNEAPFSALIHTYSWDFGVPGSTRDTSSLARPNFVFPDTGVYKVTLIINRGEECSDSATTLVKVYPGFFPGFIVDGSCKLADFKFIDTTNTRYGLVNKWSWSFGDETTLADSSHAQNPHWRYTKTGLKTVSMIVESSKGCIDTITRNNVEVRDKPIVTLPFRDTLICSMDTLQLDAKGGNNFSWLPNANIINAYSASPLVFPKTTTTYHVTLDDNGCINNDSIRVRVVDFVTLSAGADTTICLTDAALLNPSGNGLRYVWTPAATLNNPLLKRPSATPLVSTTYQVTATIGKCQATDQVVVSTIPYPTSRVGPDATICYDDTVQIRATIKGAAFTWSPVNTLINASTLTPMAYPLQTTAYVLTVTDVLGCPKPGRDTVVITVLPRILANAGRDTSVIAGQPLQLEASGGEFYEWSPPLGLNRASIQTPTAILDDDMIYSLKVSTQFGCFAFDTIMVKVFKAAPDVFVPSAFTPGKSTNSRFRPIPVGISKIDVFRIYNRWGQLLYSSNDSTTGWDGTFAGKPQDAGTYVWTVRASDYTGKSVVKKGALVLIR